MQSPPAQLCNVVHIRDGHALLRAFHVCSAFLHQATPLINFGSQTFCNHFRLGD